MRRLLLLTLLGLGLLPMAARAQNPGTPLVGSYEGTLGGKYPIRLQLSTRDSVLTGQYYYQRTGCLLELTGRVMAEGAVALRETTATDTATTGRFVARLLPDRSLTGTWYNAAGTVLLPFRLTRVVSKATAPARVRTRTYLGSFVVPVVTVPDAGVTARLANQFTLERLAGESLAALREEQEEQRREGYHGGLQDLSYSVNYNSRGLLGITSSVEGVGASIWHSYSTQNIDLNTGFPVYVDDEIRPEQLARFLALGQRRLRRVMESTVLEQSELLSEDDKAGLRAEQFSLSSVQQYVLGPTGLVFDHTAQYPMSNFLFRTLQGTFTVAFTYAELMPFLKPDSPLRRLAPASVR